MILIADDNSQVRRMMRELIEDIDPEIVECEDGGGAIEAYEEHHPDFVLMDIHMRPVDGLTATREILSRYPEAKIIAVTQYQDTSTRETAMSLGACAFVGKDDLMSLRSLLRTK
jgi:two-component system response regulator DegU